MAVAQIGIEQARRKLGELVTAAARDREVTVITKNGVPAAAITPISGDFRDGLLAAMREWRAFKELVEGLDDYDARGHSLDGRVSASP
jgi:prevent-host-death family protein